jgi:hypothetical protein
MREIAPDIICWSAFHPGIRTDVYSYALIESGILLDPMLPPEGGLDALAALNPRQIVLTNRHHHRDAAAIADRFGVPVRVSSPGVDEASKHVRVTPFDWGEQLAPGVTALEVAAICPDESAIHVSGESTALACADGVIRIAGELCFVPDFLIGDDPEPVKAELRDAYRRLLDLEFEHLLLAHGEPVIGEGHEALAAFVGS